MQRMKKHFPSVVIIMILFVTGLTFANAFRSQSKIGVPIAFGDENEGDDENEDENERDDEEDEADNENEDGNENEEDDERDEDERDDQESSQIRRSRAGVTTQRTVLQKDDDEDDDEDKEDEDENELQEEIRDLNKDIRKLESKIAVLSANGISVVAFVPVLAEVKSLAVQAASAVAAKSVEAENLIENADKKLERLKKLIKMTLGDDDEDEDNDENEDREDAIEEVQELTGDINKIEVRLNAVSAGGVDVAAMRTLLDGVKILLAQAKEKLTVEDFAGAEATAEMADKKLDALKHSMELAFGDDDEDDDAKEYRNKVAEFVHNLKAIGELDGGIGQQVNLVAQAQNDSQQKVENSINEINDRSAFVRFLVGPKYGSISEIQTAITENQNRINALTGVMNQITDPAVRVVLQDQINLLGQENNNLKAFIAENEKGVSLFGWLARMFN